MSEILGHYKTLDWTGAGDLGELWRGRDTRLGRTVTIRAVDTSLTDDPTRRAQLLRDARAAEQLNHPNIAALYEIGEAENDIFLISEFAPGETLKTTIAGGLLNPRRAIDLAVQIADALADAHAAGIVYTDIKPENIIVTPKGNAKVLDFGLAAWTRGGQERSQAAQLVAGGTGTTMETASYLSPEQVIGEPVDCRTDVFSLAVILFEMTTGKLPFAGSNPGAVALQIAQAAAPVASALSKALPVELDPILAKALSKSPDQRYEAATLAAELRSVGAILDVRADLIEAATASVVTRSTPRPSRKWIPLMIGLVALGAAAAWLMRGTLAALR